MLNRKEPFIVIVTLKGDVFHYTPPPLGSENTGQITPLSDEFQRRLGNARLAPGSFIITDKDRVANCDSEGLRVHMGIKTTRDNLKTRSDINRNKSDLNARRITAIA